MENYKHKPRYAFAITAATVFILSLIQFLLYYVPYGFYYENAPLLFISYYVTNFIEALLPVGAALVIFLTRSSGIKNKVIPTLLISLTRLIYSVPYYYIYYVSDVFNSGEALTLAFLISIFFLLFFFLQTFVCILLMNYAEKRAGKAFEDRHRAHIFDVDDHVNFGIVLSVMLIFVIFFIRECVSTVRYLIENTGTYRVGEILTIVGSFIIIFIFALTHYVLMSLLKNALLKKQEAENE